MSEGGFDSDTIPKFDLRSVGDFVIENVAKYEDLNIPEEEKNKLFLEILSQSLSSGKINKSPLRGGAYIDIYHPEYEGKELPLAVKVLKNTKHGRARRDLRQWLERGKLEEFQEVLDDSSFVLLHDKNKGVRFEDLVDEEKLLVVSAWEHRKHEELYGPYVMPAIFVSFTSEEDIVADEPFLPKWAVDFNPRDLRDFEKSMGKGELIEEGRLTEDGKEIIIKKGQTVYAMVQNFAEDLSPSIFRLPRNYQITEKMVAQIEDLAEKIEAGVEKSGYYPDPSMDRFNSNNLRFTKDGRLILIDTNSLRDYRDRDYKAEYRQTAHAPLVLRELAKELRGEIKT